MRNLLDITKEFIEGRHLQGHKIAIAVSGGPDSMALLYALNSVRESCQLDIHALTVDHGLRAESRDEAEMVGQYCLNLKINHTILTWQGEKPQTRLQEIARKVRYQLLMEYCLHHNIRHLILAHHLDDQIETFFQRLFKGSGVRGLAGMEDTAQKDDIFLCRPYLNVRKNELLEFCAHHQIPHAKDPSNEKDKFERVRIRQAIMQIEEHGFDTQNISKTIEHLGEMNSFLKSQIDQALIELKTSEGISFSKFFALHPFLQKEVLREFLLRLDDTENYAPKYEKIEGLINALHQKKKHTLNGYIWSVKGDEIRWKKENR